MQSAGPLSDDEVERFVTDGFVRLDHAFDREVAAAGCEVLYEQLRAESPDFDRADARTWPGPVARLAGSAAEPFLVAANGPRLTAALDQLVGRGRWLAKLGLGTFPVRFPHETPPDDAGWHVDGSYSGPDGTFWANIHSRGRALLLLFLFTDIGAHDAPTRIRVGSHLLVARRLEAAGDDGLSFAVVTDALARLDSLAVAQATGAAGDVYLCHPFLVHAADRHHGSSPRVIAQPGLELVDGQLSIDRADDDYSPVERAIRIGLGSG